MVTTRTGAGPSSAAARLSADGAPEVVDAPGEHPMFRQPNLAPPHFTGEGSAAVNGPAARRFLFLLAKYFAVFAIVSDAAMLLVVANCLDGPALEWFMSCDSTLDTFTAFEEAFLAFFSPLDNTLQARQALWSCVQTSDTSTYITRFIQLCLRIPGITDDEKLDRFLQGLKPPVRTECMMRRVATFAEACLCANSYDLAKAIGGHGNTPAPAPAVKPPNARVNAIHDRAPAPPPTGYPPAARRPGQPRPPITPAEREHLQANNGCTYCRKLGHTLQECTLRPPRPNA